MTGGEQNRVTQRHEPVHRGQPELDGPCRGGAASRVDVHPTGSRPGLTSVVDPLAAVSATPRDAIPPVDDRQIRAGPTGDLLVACVVSGHDDVRTASAIEPVHATPAVEVVLSA